MNRSLWAIQAANDFVDRIRRIEALNEDTPYRAVSSEAADVEAVRVMTIHGSKGLEFRAVHFPSLATMYMPNSWRGVRISPPPSLAHLAMQPDGHEAEEECLFFVGLSRAQGLSFAKPRREIHDAKCKRVEIPDSDCWRDSSQAISGVWEVLCH